MLTYGLALGSNLGDSRGLLAEARRRLDPSAACAPLYRSEPVACPPGSPLFLNTVIEFRSGLEPLALLDKAQSIEAELGREPGASRSPNAPRPVDIDLLYASDRVLDSVRLTLPHPRLHLRRFVLQPLVDLRPELVLPGFSEPASTLLARLQSDEPPLTMVATSW